MEFVIISGRSGSGKSTALQLLEDNGYICIDNLPINLLTALITEVSDTCNDDCPRFAVGIDARDFRGHLDQFPDILAEAKAQNAQFTVLYLDANDSVLMTRFNETRRKHPLSGPEVGLEEAIQSESAILKPVATLSDITINTSNLSLHELRSAIKKRVIGNESDNLALTFVSFGFKYGVPVDSDFIFDVRSLPNPFWRADLREFNGTQKPVIDFLLSHDEVVDMRDDILGFLKKWIPSFKANNRSYLTIAIGCTGGMHRSVFLVENLAQSFKTQLKNVQIRHRQLTIQAEEH